VWLTKTPLVGGHEDGDEFTVGTFTQPITCIAYHIGSWADEPGFSEIRLKSGHTAAGWLSTVVAKDGYAVGGINVDSGSNFLHAMQFIFMRIGRDGRLDPNDRYTSDWIGRPLGPVQTLSSPGARVVGFHGRKMALIHSIGLILASNDAPVASAPSTVPRRVVPSSSPPPSPPRKRQTSDDDDRSRFSFRSFSNLRPATPKSTAKPAPKAAKSESPVVTTPPAKLPKVVREALDSVLLVEHPLASGSGFAVAKNIVATNAHVVDGAFPDEITVRHGDETNAPERISRVLYFDRARDLCLLEGKMDLKSLPVRSDYVLQPGESVVLMGNPSVRGGILMRNVTNQGKLRTLVHIEGQDLYHIDANVNPGWSGGPVVDANANVIAIVVMKASDAVVDEIRGAMRKLDQDFRDVAGGTAGGIAYGIPGSALAKVLGDATLKDQKRQAATNDKYSAQALVGRMHVLTRLAMLRMQVNVPLQVRMEAKAFAQGRLPARPNRFSTVRVEYIRLVPEELAAAFRLLLNSEEVEQTERHFSKDLDTRIGAIAESPYVVDEVKRDAKVLKNKIKEAAAYAERPSNSYATFSVKVNGFSRDFKQILERLDEKVDYEDR
jgi:S1-C subfamily serine protease